MNKLNIINLIKVDEYSLTSKYLQIANSIVREIKNENIKLGDNLPSINDLSLELEISRDTVERGYRHLRSLGIIDSVPRRGYYVKSIDFENPYKILLLFNKLSEHKKKIFDSFFEILGEQAVIDFYIYNNDFALFKQLLTNRREDYTHFVIIPHFIEGDENPDEIINTIPKEQLILLDKLVPNISGDFAAAYENFEDDIYSALKEAIEPLSKYHTIKIIFPEHSYYPPEILDGFKNFCQDYTFNYEVVSDIAEETISEGEVYINVMEKDLITLIEKVLQLNLKVGQQVGIISYNEIPIKKLILNGITTISTDFKEMGRIAAELVVSNAKEKVAVPFKLTLRSSL